MSLGISHTIRVKQFDGMTIDEDINKWLDKHPDLEIIDIKFTSSATYDDWGTDALVIYRRNY